MRLSSGETSRYARFLSPESSSDAIPACASAAAGLRILVTGAGGSIGSALVRTLAAAEPARLILLDSSEHNLFRIQRHLETARARVPHEAVLGSVTCASLLDRVFSRFRPQIVYHVAALKHVPLLELNPFAAVRTNTLGTRTLAEACLRHEASRLVLVSTDKAVNPHSVMGVSKRLAELVVVTLSDTRCSMNAIRLGNVIGSSGSVVPIFQQQIAQGGPVTVTDPEAARYFMALHDAVWAILAAGAAECSERILLPELGEPERILDLAHFLIDASGRAGSEVPVQFIGLRPGEKLREDLVFGNEIRGGVARDGLEAIVTPRPTPATLHDWMERLAGHIAGNDLAGLVRALSAAVPEYKASALMLAAGEGVPQ